MHHSHIPIRSIPIRSIVSITLLSFAFSAGAETVTSIIEDQSALAVTIYNNNLALVKDQRALNIPQGEHDVEFIGVSGQIIPQTALLRSTSQNERLAVLEQNFDFDLLTPDKLLEKYLGKTIQIVKTNPANGKETTQNAEVLATNNGVIVEINGNVETNPNGRFIFPALPDNLRAQPTLTTTVVNSAAGKDNYELSYLTNGLSWNADYVAEITDESHFDLASWVTLSNNSNTEYRNVKIQLVAGDINRVQEPRPQVMMMKSVRAEAMQSDMESESLMEYKLYSLPRATNLANAQTKQVSLFNAANITSEQELIFSSPVIAPYNSMSDEQKLKPTLKLKFKNDKKSNLGIPLPKGIVRVYSRDSQGNAQFVGEDRLDHTAENETVSLTLGQSFDVSAIRKATNYKVITDKNGIFEFEVSYELLIKNAKATEVKVTIEEQFAGDWAISQSSEKFTKTNATTATWSATIPPKGESNLTFTAKVKSR